MLETLISSKTRIKLLYKFFLNSSAVSYLRGLEEEFGESSNGIRLELNKFEQAGFLESYSEGNKKLYRVNSKHPLYKDIHNIVLKMTGLDHVIDFVLTQMGDVQKVYLVGKMSTGLDTEIIDLVLVGEINKEFLLDLIGKAEKKIQKKIRFLHYTTAEFDLNKIKDAGNPLLLYSK